MNWNEKNLDSNSDDIVVSCESMSSNGTPNSRACPEDSVFAFIFISLYFCHLSIFSPLHLFLSLFFFLKIFCFFNPFHSLSTFLSRFLFSLPPPLFSPCSLCTGRFVQVFCDATPLFCVSVSVWIEIHIICELTGFGFSCTKD